MSLLEKRILKYPLKYAVLALSRRKEYAHYGEDEIFAYVPARCALVKDETRYYGNGTSETLHHVVFTWDSEIYRRSQFQDVSKEIVKPEYVGRNVTKVERVFDNLEECQKVAAEENKKLCGRNLSYLSCCGKSGEQFWKEYTALEKVFDNDVAKAQEFAMTRINDNPNVEVEG